MQDRNFDDIAEKFSRNIYGTTKGQLRQAILWQDLDHVLAEMGPQKLRVLDAGGGEGQTAIKMAERGHQVILCDLSAQMIDRAKTGGRSKRCERQHAIYTLRRSGCCFAFGNAR
ncbi:metallothionein SmtA [Escherichia coli]|uniref:Metallothionein SmtA n=1 Tax=Escherichia coli TaxID=562 RepID=A0A376KYE6_ECOLX|nr:metallothionein SmtA [Escherichia coli]